MKVEIDIDLLEKIIKYLGDGFVYDEAYHWDRPNVCYDCNASYKESAYNNQTDYLKHNKDCEFEALINELNKAYDAHKTNG